MLKGCMYIMFDIVDTAFSYGREMIVCLFLQESSKVKESSLHEIWNADIAFLHSGAGMPLGDTNINQMVSMICTGIRLRNRGGIGIMFILRRLMKKLNNFSPETIIIVNIS